MGGERINFTTHSEVKCHSWWRWWGEHTLVPHPHRCPVASGQGELYSGRTLSAAFDTCMVITFRMPCFGQTITNFRQAKTSFSTTPKKAFYTEIIIAKTFLKNILRQSSWPGVDWIPHKLCWPDWMNKVAGIPFFLNF